MKLLQKVIKYGARLVAPLAQVEAHHNPEKIITPGMPELLRQTTAQGAVLLESVAEATNDKYDFAIIESDENTLLFDHRPMIRALAAEAEAGESAGIMAAKFMNTLCAMAAELCCRIRGRTGTDRVVLSGGVFQNQYLLRRITAALEECGLRVWRHCRVSANDEGISLGQTMIAARRMSHVSCDPSENTGN